MIIIECVGCGNMIGVHKENSLCDKCIELDKLRSTVVRYEKALCALLDLSAGTDQDILIDIISDTLLGHELMEQYEKNVLEGADLLAQFLE